MTPEALVGRLGIKVANWIRRHRPAIGGVFLEGGATAVAVLREFGATRFAVIGEAGPGAPFLEAMGMDLPVFCPKPGSYPWPVEVFRE